MNLLHIDSSVLGEHSVSRELSAAVAREIRSAAAEAHYHYRDLAVAPPAHLSGSLLQALRAPADAATALQSGMQVDVQLTEELLTEFLAADVVVVGAPMYNFSVPSTLKAWIDRLAQSGRTFRYTAQGAVGLAGGKRVIIVSSRGGQIEGTAAQIALDHQEAYLRTIFNFFGITDIEVVRAEGIGLGAEARQAAMQQAHQRVGQVVEHMLARPEAAAA